MAENPLKFGCVLFDDTAQHNTGWASQEGGEPFRVAATKDLASDTIWWTNLPYQVAQYSGLLQHSRFRKNDYLRTKMHAIFKDMNLVGGMQSCVPLSLIFERVIRVVQRLMKFKSDDIPQLMLRSGVREKVMGHDPVHEESVYAALNQADAPWSITESTYDMVSAQEKEVVMLRLPPREHAHYVMSTPVPTGKWEHVDLSLTSSEAVDAWIASITGPAVINITANNFSSEYNAIYNFGSKLGGSKSNRQWVTTQELISILPVADVKAHSAYVNSAMSPDSGWLHVFNNLPDNVDLSYSANIAFDNIWSGICGSVWPPPSQRGPERTWINDYAPFVRAMDKLACLEKAVMLQKMGFDVDGYGAGKVMVRKHSHNDALSFYQAARELNMLPPALGLPGESVQGERPDGALGLLRILLALSRSEEMLKADKIIVDQILSGEK